MTTEPSPILSLAGVTVQVREGKVPRYKRVRGCKRCHVSDFHIRSRMVVISPTAVAHFGADYGETECGIDATGDRWWWPL